MEAKIPGVSRAALEVFARAAQRATGVKGEVNVLVTGTRQIRALNRRFRAQDKATDVLSFPAEVPSASVKVAGDIAISAPAAVASARLLGHSAGAEVRILMLHGLLHLAGMDHENDSGKMARVEARLRRKLGLPVALIERAAGDGRQGTKRAARVSGRTASGKRKR